MERLHVQWMDLPGPTDVMSFPMDELRPGSEDAEPEPGLLGDVVLCPTVAAQQAVQAGHTHGGGAAAAHHARHPAPARLRPRRAGRGGADVRAAAPAAAHLPGRSGPTRAMITPDARLALAVVLLIVLRRCSRRGRGVGLEGDPAARRAAGRGRPARRVGAAGRGQQQRSVPVGVDVRPGGLRVVRRGVRDDHLRGRVRPAVGRAAGRRGDHGGRLVRAGRGEPAHGRSPARRDRRPAQRARCCSGWPGCSARWPGCSSRSATRSLPGAASGTARSPPSPSCASCSTWPGRTP